MFFVYDVCVHDKVYREVPGVEFSNPVHIGDFVTASEEGSEYEVFQVAHSGYGGGSAIHIRPPKES